MVLWHEQSYRYHTEMLNFKKLTAEMVDAMGKEHRYLRQDLGAAGDRVERAERELDYLERATSPRACVDPADKVHEQGVWRAGTSRRTREQVEEDEGEWEEVRSEVSGEKRRDRAVQELGFGPPEWHAAFDRFSRSVG